MGGRTTIAVCVLFAGSCAETGTPGPLNRPALRASQPRSITATQWPAPRFEGLSAAAGVLRVLGPVGQMVREEESVAVRDKVRAGRVPDPAVAIRANLVNALAQRFSLIVAPGVRISPPAVVAKPTAGTPRQPIELDTDQPKVHPPTTVEQLSERYKDVDLVLDVRTAEWGFAAVSTNGYGITYDGSLQLVDTRSKRVLAAGRCHPIPVGSSDAPGYDQLLANDAALLKEKLQSLEQYCSDDYRTRILGIYGQ